jgi:5-methylcytosine-specific restriction endonuclease McrA
MELITRLEAIEQNQSWFFTGIPCKNGHIDKIGVKRWNCYQCTRDYKKLQREKNPDIIKAQKKESYKRNFEKIAKKAKENYHLVKEERSLYLKDYYQKNKEHLKEKATKYFHENKESVYKYKKVWSKTEKGINNTRAVKITRRNAGSIKASDIKLLKERAKNKCYWCNCDISKGFHIDHYNPIYLGGKSNIDNLVLSCPKCNISKNKKNPYEFAITKGKLL